jgi:hypothetical protein
MRVTRLLLLPQAYIGIETGGIASLYPPSQWNQVGGEGAKLTSLLPKKITMGEPMYSICKCQII